MIHAFVAVVLWGALALGWGYALTRMAAIDSPDFVETERAKLQLVDLLALFATLQFPIWISARSIRRMSVEGPIAIVLGLVLCAVFTAMWWRGASALTRLGIDDWRRRALLLGLLLPATLSGGIVALALLLASPWMFVDSLRFGETTRLVGLTVLIGWAIGFGARWVFQGAMTPSTNNDTVTTEIESKP